MSDMFDHELDAYESLNHEDGIGESDGNYDPNYYHQWFDFVTIKSETKKSYLIELKQDFEVWIPKKIVRKITEKRIFAHGEIFYSIVKNKAISLKNKQEAA